MHTTEEAGERQETSSTRTGMRCRAPGRSTFVFAAAVLLTSCAGCADGTSPSAAGESPPAQGNGLSGKLVLTGSSTVAPVAAEIGKRFEERHPGVRVNVQTGGSSRGIADARSGTADIGMASRGLARDEQDLMSHRIAMDGICMIVHADNPIEALTDRQVREIYTGRIESWNDLGGPDEPLVVVHKAEGRATLEVFLDYYGLNNADVQADVIVGDNQQGIKTVAGNPQAIGYVSIGAADYEAQHGTPIKLLKAGNVAPTPANVASGEFPVTRPLNLVTREEPTGLAGEFIEFARSPQVHDLVEALYFVPLKR